MEWARMLAYVTGTVDQELLLRNEYLAAENRILKAQLKGRLTLSGTERATLGEIVAHAPITAQGCAGRSSGPTIRKGCRYARSVGPASSLRADMIFGKDSESVADSPARHGARGRYVGGRGAADCCRY
jgi:hypothetical protein